MQWLTLFLELWRGDLRLQTQSLPLWGQPVPFPLQHHQTSSKVFESDFEQLFFISV